jgi:Xaa-Pro aminopeptidase
VREESAVRGLCALVSFSRGGGAHDRIADGLWLAGLFTPQPFVPDLSGRWRAAGHVAVVVAVRGPVTAVVESADSRPAAVADEVVVSEDLVAAAATALTDAVAARERARVGVLGADAVPFTWWAALEELLREGCPGVTLEPADDLVMELRRIKSPGEQRLMREAGLLGAQAMTAALDAAVPDSSEAHVAAALVEHVLREGGAVYDVVVSSGPASVTLGPSGGAAGAAGWTTRRLMAGDLLRIDAYGSVAGYLFDLARTVVVGGDASDEEAELIEAVRGSVQAGIDVLRPGVALSDVARCCEQALATSAHARRHGVPEHLMGGYWGHGLGLGFEPPWIGPDSQAVVEPGLCLAIERRAAVPGLGGAQHEDDVLIKPDGAQLLTELTD